MKNVRFCAHRGLSALIPENTIPAFSAAYSLGADEIEFDIRLTRDGQMVVSHDSKLERISDGVGLISDYTLKELLKLNIGITKCWQIGFCTPDDIFRLFAGKLCFNIHLKEHGEDGSLVRELVRLIKRYNSKKSVYIAASPSELEYIVRYAPDIERTAIQLKKDTMPIYNIASEYKCTRVQFWHGLFDKDLVNRMHDDGIKCNVYFADTYEEYDMYTNIGIDTILTNRMDIAKHYRDNQQSLLEY